MSNKFIDYFTSDKFREDMAKVGPGTPPYGHSTPTSEVFKVLAEASEKNAQASPQK